MKYPVADYPSEPVQVINFVRELSGWLASEIYNGVCRYLEDKLPADPFELLSKFGIHESRVKKPRSVMELFEFDTSLARGAFTMYAFIAEMAVNAGDHITGEDYKHR